LCYPKNARVFFLNRLAQEEEGGKGGVKKSKKRGTSATTAKKKCPHFETETGFKGTWER